MKIKTTLKKLKRGDVSSVDPNPQVGVPWICLPYIYVWVVWEKNFA